MCFSTAAAWISRIERLSSLMGFEHWIKPHRTLRTTRESYSLPAGDHHFPVRVEVERLASVRLQVAEEAALGAAESEHRHRRGDADVHAGHSGVDLVLELARGLAAR